MCLHHPGPPSLRLFRRRPSSSLFASLSYLLPLRQQEERMRRTAMPRQPDLLDSTPVTLVSLPSQTGLELVQLLRQLLIELMSQQPANAPLEVSDREQDYP